MVEALRGGPRMSWQQERPREKEGKMKHVKNAR